MNSVSGLYIRDGDEIWVVEVIIKRKGTYAKPVDCLTPATTVDRRSASIA
jgi:hypothetical protein